MLRDEPDKTGGHRNGLESSSLYRSGVGSGRSLASRTDLSVAVAGFVFSVFVHIGFLSGLPGTFFFVFFVFFPRKKATSIRFASPSPTVPHGSDGRHVQQEDEGDAGSAEDQLGPGRDGKPRKMFSRDIVVAPRRRKTVLGTPYDGG